MADRYKNEITAFGQRLKSFRKQRGLSQLDLELATKTINRSDISKIERGEINVSFSTIVKLAEALGLETYELLKKI
jgi:HTH-type transcriptional regulator, competence development regulator